MISFTGKIWFLPPIHSMTALLPGIPSSHPLVFPVSTEECVAAWLSHRASLVCTRWVSYQKSLFLQSTITLTMNQHLQNHPQKIAVRTNTVTDWVRFFSRELCRLILDKLNLFERSSTSHVGALHVLQKMLSTVSIWLRVMLRQKAENFCSKCF